MSGPIANTDQAAAWDGPTGHHWATHDARYQTVSRRHGERLLERAAIQTGEAVLDIGCGTGATTCDAGAAANPGETLGVDLSAEMLAVARARAAERGLDNVRFERADAQVHDLGEARFAIAISRFGAMFFDDAPAAFANIASAIRPGGRIVLLTWARLDENEWLMATRGALSADEPVPAPPAEAPGMFGLSDPERIRSLLTSAGFREVETEVIDQPCELGDDAEEATQFILGVGFARALLEEVTPKEREVRVERLRRLLRDRETPHGVLLGARTLLTTARLH